MKYNITLLYVEDDKSAQENIRMLLSDEIKDLYQAFDGVEALEIYKKYKPDIVVTDINMPLMDGLTFAKKVKEINEDQPLIVISGYDNRENLLKSINIGINQFLVKPLNIDTLLEQISKIIAKQKEHEEYTSIAYRDKLTKTYNRHYFDIYLEQSIQEAQQNHEALSLFFIDLDNLKSLNDIYGHQVGDEALESIARNIKKSIRENDTLARIGGDEFALIVKDVKNIADLHNIAKKILNAATITLKIGEKRLHLSCSIGICNYSQKINSAQKLLHCADIAMYKVKKSTKENYFIQPS